MSVHTCEMYRCDACHKETWVNAIEHKPLLCSATACAGVRRVVDPRPSRIAELEDERVGLRHGIVGLPPAAPDSEAYLRGYDYAMKAREDLVRQIDVARIMAKRQFEMLRDIRMRADAATGIDRSRNDVREAGALGAVKHLIERYKTVRGDS